MQIVHGSTSCPVRAPGPVVTIGNFDGVHRGHRALVSRCIEHARSLDTAAWVFTFEPPPVRVLRPDHAAPRIQCLSERLALLADLGIDLCVVERFTREFATLEASAFADQVIGGRLGAQALVLGWDFRFGQGRGGSVESMRTSIDIPIHQVEAVLKDGVPISSSRIRALVHEGNVAEAAILLARPHSLTGRVERGASRGRQLGFPTANVHVQTELQPPLGVYAVRAILEDGTRVDGIANLGRRPTFESGPVILEVHLLDWTGDLYRQTITVELVDLIREERQFEGAEDLVRQIRRDTVTARERLR